MLSSNLLDLVLGSLGPSTVTLMALLYVAICWGADPMTIDSEKDFPRPLRPTNLKSLNLATWFFMTAVQLRSSAQQFSSFPAFKVTIVPSGTSSNATTLKAMGRLLLLLQCVGNTLHKMLGDPVCTSSPWLSWRLSYSRRCKSIILFVKLGRCI